MNKEQLFEKFEELFPDWAPRVKSYKKIGSRTLAITFTKKEENKEPREVSRVFLYGGTENWHFGTKLWRKRPEKTKRKYKKEVKINEK